MIAPNSTDDARKRQPYMPYMRVKGNERLECIINPLIPLFRHRLHVRRSFLSLDRGQAIVDHTQVDAEGRHEPCGTLNHDFDLVPRQCVLVPRSPRVGAVAKRLILDQCSKLRKLDSVGML